jgi:hypothetical protein
MAVGLITGIAALLTTIWMWSVGIVETVGPPDVSPTDQDA